MRRMVGILLAVLVLCLCSCSASGGESLDWAEESFVSVISRYGKLIPGGGLQWRMPQQEFRESRYFTEEVDAASDAFEEDRARSIRYDSGEIMTWYSPVASVHVEDPGLDMSVEYGFNKQGSLTCSTYHCVLGDCTAEEFAEKVEAIRADISSIGLDPPTENTETPLTEKSVSGKSSCLQWHTDNGEFVELAYAGAQKTVEVRVSLFNFQEL